MDFDTLEFDLLLPTKLLNLIALAQAADLETKVTETHITFSDTNGRFTLGITNADCYSLDEAFEFVAERQKQKVIRDQRTKLLKSAEYKLRQTLTAEELAVFNSHYSLRI